MRLHTVMYIFVSLHIYTIRVGVLPCRRLLSFGNERTRMDVNAGMRKYVHGYIHTHGLSCTIGVSQQRRRLNAIKTTHADGNGCNEVKCEKEALLTGITRGRTLMLEMFIMILMTEFTLSHVMQIYKYTLQE